MHAGFHRNPGVLLCSGVYNTVKMALIPVLIRHLLIIFALDVLAYQRHILKEREFENCQNFTFPRPSQWLCMTGITVI